MRKLFLALVFTLWSGVAVAGVYWLPNYLKNNIDTNHRTDTAPDGSGDRHDLTCSVYGGCLGIPANMTCSNDFTVDGKTCYKSCSCKSGYIRANSSDICKGCYNPCDTHTAVDAPYGCEKYFSDCASKCEKAYPDNCRNQTAVPDLGFGCKTYFTDCPSKCQTAYADNCHSHTAVSTPYGCEKYFDDCSSKCEKAYADNCRNYSSKPAASSCANGCAQGKTYTDCSSKCSVGCKAKCDIGYHLSSDELSCVADGCPDGYEEGKTCGAGYKRLQSGQSGATPCYTCEVIPCTAGSTSCSGATVAKENGYYSGENKCYTCQTCEQAGKKTCNGSCISASECCGCTSLQKCVSGTCVSPRCSDLYDGKSNTQAIVNQIGADGLAATAANQFYAPGVSKNDATFGQGTWYLPAIGELMDMYGIDADAMTDGSGTTGAVGDNKTAINAALKKLKNHGVEANTLSNYWHWSSSEYKDKTSWVLRMEDCFRSGFSKYYVMENYGNIRVFNLLSIIGAQLGDVVYSDKSYGSASNYDSSKTAVGVVAGFSDDGGSVKIVNLKDLTFSDDSQAGNFDPDNPYSGDTEYAKWSTDTDAGQTNITAIPDYDYSALLAAAQSGVCFSPD